MAKQIGNIFKKVDWPLVVVYCILVFAGWFNIYSAVFDESASSIFAVSQKYGKQLIWIGAAFLWATIILIIDSGVYFSFSYLIYLVVILSLIIVYFIAPEIKGARSWVEIGSLRLQPSEFAKLATSLAVARYLGSYGIKVEKFGEILKAGIFLFIPIALIVLQGDAGTSLVFLSFFLVFFREGMPPIYLLIGVGMLLIFSLSIVWGGSTISMVVIAVCLIAFLNYALNKKHKLPLLTIALVSLAFVVPLFVYYVFELDINQLIIFLFGFVVVAIPTVIFAYKKRAWLLFLIWGIGLAGVATSQSVEYVFNNVLEEHQQKRINVFFGLESDPKGSEFNVIQSKIAIGSGDWAGKGFLNGTQTKNDFVPEQSTDFIFCTIGEEWGFLGSVTIIGLFVFLILRIMRNAERQRTKFSRIYGYCVACILFFHLMVNVGMTIGLMPIIGIPLPFFSYGGSSLWGFTILLFIFIKLDANREELIQ